MRLKGMIAIVVQMISVLICLILALNWSLSSIKVYSIWFSLDRRFPPAFTSMFKFLILKKMSSE